MPAVKIKIQCVHCAARFAGEKAKIKMVAACPRCKQSVNWYRRLFGPNDTQPMSPVSPDQTNAGIEPLAKVESQSSRAGTTLTRMSSAATSVSPKPIFSSNQPSSSSRIVITAVVAAVIVVVSLVAVVSFWIGASSGSTDPANVATSTPSDFNQVERRDTWREVRDPGNGRAFPTPDEGRVWDWDDIEPNKPASSFEPDAEHVAEAGEVSEEAARTNPTGDRPRSDHDRLDSRLTSYRHALLAQDGEALLGLVAPWERTGCPPLTAKITKVEICEVEFHHTDLAARVWVRGEGSIARLPYLLESTEGFTHWVWVDNDWYVSQMETAPLVAIATPMKVVTGDAKKLQSVLQNRPAIYRRCLQKSDELLRAAHVALEESRQSHSFEVKEFWIEAAKEYANAAESVNNLIFIIIESDDDLASQLLSLKDGGTESINYHDWNAESERRSKVDIGEPPPDIVNCSRCGGTGRVPKSQAEIDRELQKAMQDAMRGGAGSRVLPPIEKNKSCPSCGGSGNREG